MAALTELQRFDGPENVAEEAASRIVRAANEAVASRGRFILAVTGGQTPILTYRRLARSRFREAMPWAETLVVWTDERCVPPESEGSNYRMVRESLLDHVPLPADNILRIRGEDCALSEDLRYERALHRLLASAPGNNRIDLMLLGVGEDGHTASLFPRAVTLAERQRWVLPAVGPEPYPHRITLTLPMINASRTILVLATGVGKAPVVSRVFAGTCDPLWPIASVRPSEGDLVWLADRAAAP